MATAFRGNAKALGKILPTSKFYVFRSISPLSVPTALVVVLLIAVATLFSVAQFSSERRVGKIRRTPALFNLPWVSDDIQWRCIRQVSCGSALDPSSLADCGGLDVSLLDADTVLQIPLAAWTRLTLAAEWALNFARHCRGSSFPLHSPRGQFAESKFMGRPALQSSLGFRTESFIAFSSELLVEVDASLACELTRIVMPAALDY